MVVYTREMDGIDTVFLVVLSFGDSLINLQAVVPNVPSRVRVRLSTNTSLQGQEVDVSALALGLGEGVLLGYPTLSPLHRQAAFRDSCFVSDRACYSSALDMLYTSC